MSVEVQNGSRLERNICMELKYCQSDPQSRPSTANHQIQWRPLDIGIAALCDRKENYTEEKENPFNAYNLRINLNLAV